VKTSELLEDAVSGRSGKHLCTHLAVVRAPVDVNHLGANTIGFSFERKVNYDVLWSWVFSKLGYSFLELRPNTGLKVNVATYLLVSSKSSGFFFSSWENYIRYNGLLVLDSKKSKVQVLGLQGVVSIQSLVRDRDSRHLEEGEREEEKMRVTLPRDHHKLVTSHRSEQRSKVKIWEVVRTASSDRGNTAYTAKTAIQNTPREKKVYLQTSLKGLAVC
jgi:hypothetical protein